MSDEHWRPLHVRTAGKEAEHEALVDGVPDWLWQSLVEWLDRNFLRPSNPLSGMKPEAALHHLERTLRVGLDWRTGFMGAYASLLGCFKTNPQLLLSALDLALRHVGKFRTMDYLIGGLDTALREGGSAWMVAPDRLGLVQRVSPEVAGAVRAVIESGSRAGHHLGEAFRKVFGRDPDPSSGYREAVRAVEAAVCPVILAKHPKPTLGVAIAALRDAPPGKFVTVFENDPQDSKPIKAVCGLMSLVWQYQRDRHGTDDESVPLHVSQEQAEAALFAAVTLVHWFQRGFVRGI